MLDKTFKHRLSQPLFRTFSVFFCGLIGLNPSSLVSENCARTNDLRKLCHNN